MTLATFYGDLEPTLKSDASEIKGWMPIFNLVILGVRAAETPRVLCRGPAVCPVRLRGQAALRSIKFPAACAPETHSGFNLE